MVRRFILPLLLLTVLFVSSASAEDKPTFSRKTIDLGVVVSDVEKSVKFYTEAIGFKEIKGFSVPGEFCKNAGLTNGAPLTIRVLVLGEGETATKLKLMAVPDAKPKKTNSKFIHSQLGFSYITVFVTDTKAAVERLKKAGAKPVAKGPVEIPGAKAALTVVRDPDGNLVELVGP